MSGRTGVTPNTSHRGPGPLVIVLVYALLSALPIALGYAVFFLLFSW